MKKFVQSGFVGLFVAGASVLGLSAESVKAAPEASAEKSPKVDVEVPAGGKPVTYKVGGKTHQVGEGKSRTLPKVASDITLPANTKVTVTTVKGGKEEIVSFYVPKLVVLEEFDLDAIAAVVTEIGLPDPEVKKIVEAIKAIEESAVTVINITGAESTDGND